MRPCSSGIKSGICKHLFKKKVSEEDIIIWHADRLKYYTVLSCEKIYKYINLHSERICVYELERKEENALMTFQCDV